LETIINYLKKPMEIGVYNHKSIVDFSGISDYLKGVIEEYKEKVKEKPRRIPKQVIESKVSSLSESLTNLDEQYWEDEEVFDTLTSTLLQFARHIDKCRENMAGLFYLSPGIKLKSGRVVIPPRPRRVKPIFNSRIIPEVKDVISVEKESIGEKQWLFDVVTIKKNGLSVFKKELQYIPTIKKRMKILKERQQFSQRYVFRPYPWAIQLWLKDEASVIVPQDLKRFLKSAIQYFFFGEWRMSIVLSAIAVESMLADLYEEENRKPAPDTPLGDLFRQVKEKIDFPSEIIRAIQITNEARISAVHRSRFPVSDREAINALFGATNFTLWYSSHF